MKLFEIQAFLNATVHTRPDKLERDVLSACGSDLMSDVLAFSKEKGLLLTGLMNPQVIRTAEMMDLKAVVFVRGKQPTDDILQLADKKSIVIMTTDYPLYTACGLLYSNGLGGADLDATAL